MCLCAAIRCELVFNYQNPYNVVEIWLCASVIAVYVGMWTCEKRANLTATVEFFFHKLQNKSQNILVLTMDKPTIRTDIKNRGESTKNNFKVADISKPAAISI